MIFYVLLFYVLLLLISVVFFFVKKLNTRPIQVALNFPKKRPKWFSFAGKVRISRFITQYECPECGFKSMDSSVHCPRCFTKGKERPLVANTMSFQG